MRNFVPYLCQLIFTAILKVELSDMFVTAIAFKFALCNSVIAWTFSTTAYVASVKAFRQHLELLSLLHVALHVASLKALYAMLSDRLSRTQPFNGLWSGTAGWAGTRRNTHPLTPILIIGHLLSTSSIYFTIRSILLIQFSCLTVLLYNLSPGPL